VFSNGAAQIFFVALRIFKMVNIHEPLYVSSRDQLFCIFCVPVAVSFANFFPDAITRLLRYLAVVGRTTKYR